MMDLTSGGCRSNDYVIMWKVSSCGMSEAIGPVHIKERPSSDMQSRIDAEVETLYSFFCSSSFKSHCSQV